MKKCPFCAEEIQDEAVKCRFCNEFLEDDVRQAVGQKPKWYFRTSTLIVGFLFIGPLIIPVIWYNPRYSKEQKIILTCALLVLSYVLFVAASDSLKNLNELYETIGTTF